MSSERQADTTSTEKERMLDAAEDVDDDEEAEVETTDDCASDIVSSDVVVLNKEDGEEVGLEKFMSLEILLLLE